MTKSLVGVGRGLENDIRITDISVSRDHAQIKWHRDGTITVLDLMSKFGSAIQVQKPLQINSQTLQIGRTLIKCKVFQLYGIWDWLCCLKKNRLTEKENNSQEYPREFDERYDVVTET